MSKLIRINLEQLEKLRQIYPNLKDENDTVLVRSALNDLFLSWKGVKE